MKKLLLMLYFTGMSLDIWTILAVVILSSFISIFAFFIIGYYKYKKKMGGLKWNKLIKQN